MSRTPARLRPSILSLLALSTAVAMASSADAQSSRLQWQLPDGAFVEYDRTRSKAKGLGLLRKGPEAAAGFYQWEIAQKGKTKGHIEYRSSTLVDLIPQLALSLSRRAVIRSAKLRITRRFERVQAVGALRARGTVTTEGVEDLSKVVESGSFELVRDVPKYPRNVAQFYPNGVLTGRFELEDTELSFTRWVDVTAGRVQSFTAKLTGKLRPITEGGEAREFEIEEEWRLRDVLAPRYRGFQTRVDKAIADGTKFLESKLDRWLKSGALKGGETNQRSYGTGRLALILLTLVKGEPDRQKESIQKLLGMLRERHPVDSYSLGVCLMALEAYYGPPNEAEQIRQGLIDRPQPRKLSASDLELMKKWTKSLLENYDTRVDRGYFWRFNYVQGRRYDNSVTQYAVLGLRSARLCGVEIPASVWIGLASHYARERAKSESKKRPLRLPTHKEIEEFEKAAKRGGRGTVARAKRRRTESRGYGYASPKHPTGSMTCAGLAGAGICLSMLQGPLRRGNQDLAGELGECIRNGFAWMHENYDVRDNPRKERGHFYYYLYGLERACEINGVARIHDRDWYFDGAMQLLTTQNKNGSWGGAVDTSFGVLFLKRAVAPVVTTR